MIPFSPRAALCTFLVIAGLAGALTMRSPGGLFGLIGTERDGLLPIDGGGRLHENDLREIVMVVLAQEAQRSERGAICARLADEGEALASERREAARLQRAVASADPAARRALQAELDRRRNPTSKWFLPPASGARPFAEIAEANARQLDAAATALLSAPASNRIDIVLDMAALPESLRSTARDCRPLAFTAPVVAGNFAFVETHFSPARGAPDSWLHAVVKADGRWTVEAMARP